MTPHTHPDPDDLRILDHDVYTLSVDINYLCQLHIWFGEDKQRRVWMWTEYHVYNAILGQWWESSPKNMECVG